jgi:UDP-N-acetylmuramoyl-L-alanyl-D-glutamate--2,6-diaminopimelate ligase
MNAHETVATLARLGVTLRAITADSRAVVAGGAFAAFRGARVDGRDYIGDAIANGASAVLWDDDRFAWKPEWTVANAPVRDLRNALGDIADFIYGSPSEALEVIGVTGTNGKTSCAHWIAALLDRPGRRAALMGTLGNGFVGALDASPNTTPDAARLQATLAGLRDAGAACVAMEVSSHGLDQGRVNGVRFAVALFTNLTRDHLDYHGSMAAYGAAKAKLFAWPGLRAAVVNVDDAFGQRIADDVRARGDVELITYGRIAGDVHASAATTGEGGIALEVATPKGGGTVRTALVGEFNVMNLLGTLGVVLAAGMPLDEALAGMARLAPPPGRMQRLGGHGRPTVVVDYAHTPDALEKALEALRPVVVEGGGLVAVFGAGGDRDPGKRTEMGAVAARLADRVVVTNDNPRGEDPQAIANAIARGVLEAGSRRYAIELDRAKAIRAAIAAADVGDVVLVAGKGHEAYQEANGVRSPFDDVEIASGALANR